MEVSEPGPVPLNELFPMKLAEAYCPSPSNPHRGEGPWHRPALPGMEPLVSMVTGL